ncbi:pyridoxal phosphate-dependent aminotransferase [Peptococcaceae bacterium]|nr:pyridoxal phosphate-dependent aminotransferase [Peptococcaceae bacterium]
MKTIADKISVFLEKSSWIRKMFEEGDKLCKKYGADKVYDFSLGNPTTEPPKQIHQKLKELAVKPLPGMHRYMNNAGLLKTRKKVAEYISQKSSIKVPFDNIVMTCGAGGALNVVLKSILNPNDEVIVLKPYFPEYQFYIDNHCGKICEVEIDENFMPDINAIYNAISKKTKAIIINSPNNPTGVVYPEQIIAELGKVVKEKALEFGNTIYVISDEPYAKIIYENTHLPHVFNYIDNSILVTSHSKDLALPGERIGYIAVNPKLRNSKLLVDALTFCNRTLGFVNAPALMQYLVAELQHISINIAEYQKKRDILYDHLTKLGFKMIKPNGAFYLFPKSLIEDDVEFVKTALEYNILIVPGSGFGKPGHFRISYCVDMKTIQNSLPAWTALAKRYKSQKSSRS